MTTILKHKSSSHTPLDKGEKGVFTLLIFCPLYPPHIGGLENHAQQFNREMSARGHQITVFTPLVTPDTQLTETEGEVKIYRFPAFAIIPNYPVPKLWHPLFWKQLRLALKTLNNRQSSSSKFSVASFRFPVAIISRTRFFLTSLMALLVSKTMRIPWLHIEHGSDYVHLNNPLANTAARLYDHTLGRLVFHSANTLVANSKASAAFVKKFVPKRQVTVIYRGIDSEAIKNIPPADLSKDYGLKPDVCVITYCGRLIDGKGVHDLIAALGRLKGSPWHCLIIGDGPQRQSLEQKASRLRINDQVSFLGSLSWTNTIAHLKSSHLSVNPSYTEGLPTSLIEASLCDCAIIASDVGGTLEILTPGPATVLIPPGNVHRLTIAMEQFITKHETSSLNVSANSRISQLFSWPQSISNYTGVLLSLTQNQ